MGDDEPTPVEPIDEPTPVDYRQNLPEFLGVRPWLANVVFLCGALAGAVGIYFLGRWAIGGNSAFSSEFLLLVLATIPVAAVVVVVLKKRSDVHGRTIWGSATAGLVSGGCALVCIAVGGLLLLIGACFVMASGVGGR